MGATRDTDRVNTVCDDVKDKDGNHDPLLILARISRGQENKTLSKGQKLVKFNEWN